MGLDDCGLDDGGLFQADVAATKAIGAGYSTAQATRWAIAAYLEALPKPDESAAQILMSVYSQRVEDQAAFLKHLLDSIASGASTQTVVDSIAEALDAHEWHDDEMMAALNAARIAGDTALPKLRKLDRVAMRSATIGWDDEIRHTEHGEAIAKRWLAIDEREGRAPSITLHDIYIDDIPREGS